MLWSRWKKPLPNTIIPRKKKRKKTFYGNINSSLRRNEKKVSRELFIESLRRRARKKLFKVFPESNGFYTVCRIRSGAFTEFSASNFIFLLLQIVSPFFRETRQRQRHERGWKGSRSDELFCCLSSSASGVVNLNIFPFFFSFLPWKVFYFSFGENIGQ